MKALIPILLILSSCVTHRGVERWIKKHPDQLTIDSVKVIDTVQFITEKVETDTVFSTHTQDTVVIRKENLTIKTYFRNDSIYVYGECDTDTVTIIQERWVGNTLTLEDKKGLNWVKNNILILILCGLIVVQIIRK